MSVTLWMMSVFSQPQTVGCLKACPHEQLLYESLTGPALSVPQRTLHGRQAADPDTLLPMHATDVHILQVTHLLGGAAVMQTRAEWGLHATVLIHTIPRPLKHDISVQPSLDHIVKTAPQHALEHRACLFSSQQLKLCT